MENKENGIFVNTLLDLLESDNITNEINKKIIEDSIEIAYRNIELKKKNQELYNQIDNLERKNKKLERRIIELMKQYRDKTNEFTDIKIKNEKAINYIMTELITEWDIKNDGYVSGSDLPVDAITPLLNILQGEEND